MTFDDGYIPIDSMMYYGVSGDCLILDGQVRFEEIPALVEWLSEMHQAMRDD